MNTSVAYVSVLLLSQLAACAAATPPRVNAPAVPTLEQDLAMAGPVAREPAPPTEGDIQFTVTARKAKAEPEAADDDSNGTPLQATKACTSGMTSTGTNAQRVHSAQ
jgi:hypothetical protein